MRSLTLLTLSQVNMMNIAQLIKFYICSLKITSSSLTNLKATGNLYGH